MSQIRDNMMKFLTSEEIQDLVKTLAREIEADYDGKEIVLICPLKGSCLFIADLMREIHLTQQVDFVYLRSVDSGGTIEIVKDVGINITGKHVLIIEEIIDSGRKLGFLKNRILTSNPASLNVVALIDKPARRELPIRPDYVGKTIEDRYVVGYGMDSEEMGRNYKDIYIFTS